MAIPFLKSPRAASQPDDPLALFDAESETPGQPAARSSDSGLQELDPGLSLGSSAASGAVALETVLERRVFVSWLEAIAILEGTCAALAPEDGSEPGAPEPSAIFLTAEGTIEVGRGHSGDSVQRLARTLHVLTSGQAIPAPFRLFISKWIAAEGKHSVAAFARELAYFARPNGADLIREVYQRCASAPPAEPVHRTQATAETPKANAEKPKRSKAAKRPQSALIAAAVAFIVAVAVAAGIAAYFAPPAGEEGSSDIVSNLLARAADFARSLGEVKTQIGQLSSQLTAHLASGEDEAGKVAPSTTANPPNRARAAARPGQAARRPATAVSAAPASSFLGAPDIPVPTPAAAPSEAPAPASEPEAPAVAISTIDPAMVYTSADDGVSPPKMMYPQLPPPALVLGGSDALNVMEITVGNSGSVERVKLVSPPRRLTDMMLLSGAKLWKFTPASKDGQPVRYRLAVSWAASIP